MLEPGGKPRAEEETMILTRDYAQRLVRAGKAVEEGMMAEPGPWPNGTHYVILGRTDIGRTDHYCATEQDERRVLSERE